MQLYECRCVYLRHWIAIDPIPDIFYKNRVHVEPRLSVKMIFHDKINYRKKKNKRASLNMPHFMTCGANILQQHENMRGMLLECGFSN